jgi:tetratricopeptide (TPR) repeat protein
VSPFDPLGFLAFDGISLGHFLAGRYDESADAARQAIQVNPLFSINYMCLVAALSRLGQKEDAKSAVARLLELQPSFSIGRQCATVGVVPSLTAKLTDAGALRWAVSIDARHALMAISSNVACWHLTSFHAAAKVWGRNRIKRTSCAVRLH